MAIHSLLSYSYNNDIQFTTTGLFSMVPGSYLIGILYRPTGGEWVLVANNAGIPIWLP